MHTASTSQTLCVILLLGTSISACSSNDRTQDSRVSARELCSGALVYAADTLEKVRGVKEFANRDQDFLDKSVKMIGETRERGDRSSMTSGTCGVYDGKPELGHTNIRSGYYAPRDVKDPASLPGGSDRYGIGKYAAAGFWDSRLYFECISPHVKGSKNDPARIRITVDHSDTYDGQYPGLREDNIKLAYSAALALARKLECENDGGLPDPLVLRRVT